MTAAVTLTPLTDFSDRLSPMVVKELRQGLRTRLFSLTLLILHGLLLIVTLISGVNQTGEDTSWMLQGLSILVLCVIMPLRGFSAVADEIHKKTLDMLVLTRLSAVRIVFGKWLSIVAQSLLLALSLMPYVVARYVFGGADLFGELLQLALLWLIGIVIAAAVVCLSTQRQLGLRAAVIGLALIGPGFASLAFGFAFAVGGRGMRGSAGIGPMSTMLSGSITSGGKGAVVLWIIGAAAWLIFAFLSLAATRIAPVASNFAVVKRPIHAAVIGLLLVLALWSKSSGIYFGAITIVAWFASLDALVEKENAVPSVLVPFYRKGWLGRISGWFLVSGWPNGMLFSFSLTLVLAAVFYAVAGADAAQPLWFGLADVWLCATILHLTTARRAGDLLGPYIGISLIMLVVSVFLQGVSSAMVANGADPWLGLLTPSSAPATLAVLKAKGGVSMTPWILLGLGISSLWPLILLIKAALVLKRSRPLREEARRLAVAS